MSDITRQAEPLAFPSRLRPLRFRSWSGMLDVPAVAWTLVFATAALAAAIFSLTVGSSGLGLADAITAIRGLADESTARIIVEWRLSRIVFGLLGGAALAIGGTIFQSITRNPLGSPDIIGFSSGAYTGALLVSVLGAGGSLETALGALAGGILTGLLVYLLAMRGGVIGMRIIVVGVGISLLLGSFNTWLLTTMRREQALSAASWGAGSLANIGWGHTIPLVIGLLICLPLVLWRATDMRMLEMGDDAGRGLGVGADRTRIIMLTAAIGLVAMVTASAGPIAFVALAAPQLAMRITGTAGVRILPAAAMGALLLVTSDLLARVVIAPAQLPVGVVTLCLGGGYLVWLLAVPGRKGRR